MNETDQDLERFLIAEYKVLTEMTFADVDEAAANVEAAQRAYEAAKKTAATAKRKDVTKQLFEDDAGTSDERAGDAYAKARRDCAAASEAACGAALVQNARAFHGLFLAFGRALASGQTVVSDMEPWDQELAHQVAGLAEESSAAAAQQNPQEALDALLEKEEQYGGVLAALVELQKRLVAEPALRFSSLDARHIFGSVAQLAAAVTKSKQEHWSALNHQLLLRSRNPAAEMRLWTLRCMTQMWHTVGEEIVSVMPETVPYLSELLQDSDPEVEAAANELAEVMQSYLGEESLRDYL